VNVFATAAGEISSAYDRAEVIAVMEMAATTKRHIEIDMQLPQKDFERAYRYFIFGAIIALPLESFA